MCLSYICVCGFTFIGAIRRDRGECISDYVAELRRLATHCELGAYLNKPLRDRLVYGIRSEGTQKRLLSEANLPLAKAIEFSSAVKLLKRMLRN